MNANSWLDEVAWNADGLVPAVAQDAASGEVLMVAWMSRESLERTVATGEATYWSRSRRALWRKGETSGHVQKLVEVRIDCDADTVLLRVESVGGVACHTGRRRCFFRILEGAAGERRWTITDDLVEEPHAPASEQDRNAGSPSGQDSNSRAILERLEAAIAARRAADPSSSYVASLNAKGLDAILKKVGEEATEAVIAAKGGDRRAIVHEMADLWFHCLVALAWHGVPLAEVLAELERREGRSGIEERNSRPKG